MSDLLDDLPRLLTIDQLAELTQLSKQTIYTLNYKGRGPRRYRVGRQVRYRREDVVAWLESRPLD